MLVKRKFSGVIMLFLITILPFTGCDKMGEEFTTANEPTDVQQSLLQSSLAIGLSGKPDIIINTTSDVIDFAGLQQVGDLPGPDGLVTFSEAIIAANNTSGAQLVAFNILKNDAGFDGKVFTIKPGSILLEFKDNSTFIDGSTQTAFSGNTNKTGPEIKIDFPSKSEDWGFRIRSSFNIIHSIIVCNASGPGIALISPNANYNKITGCFIAGNGKTPWGTAGVYIVDGASYNIIGGNSINDRNIISGNIGPGTVIDGDPAYTQTRPCSNIIIGNFIGTDYTGTEALPNGGAGINITNTFNNIIERNVISSNTEFGIIFWNNAHNNSVIGNFIGTDCTGTKALSNWRGIGIWHNCYDNIIGGPSKNARNIISANREAGIQMGDQIYGNKIIGNYIGTDISGQPTLGNGTTGIGIFYNSTNNIIGGAEKNSGNLIAGNNGPGIRMTDNDPPNYPPCTGIRISRNMIYSNNGLGIDINMDGVTPNDLGDGDTGPNNLMNYPVLNEANVTQGKLNVKGTIDTQNPEIVTIEFFTNPVPNPGGDPSGNGEGAIYLGSYLPNSLGEINATLPKVAPGTLITATATDANGNTSEFSAYIEAR
jgi:parallel beta-helix repeat protein